MQYAHGKNDTVIEFQSPTLNDSLNQHVRTSIHLDNWTKELKPFTYYPDPVFDNLTKNVINEASIIIVTVSPSRRGSFISFSEYLSFLLEKLSIC